MPHALTERQKEYLQFLRQYIQLNETTPRLEDIAGHFKVKPPTAHKTLKALQNKGFLIFRRGSVSGYYIRLAERGGMGEKVIELMVTGKVNRYGELFDFPGMHGHFPVALQGVDAMQVFALIAAEDIPQANILAGDYLICDYGKRAQPGDIAILPFGKKSNRWMLSQIHHLTMDRDLESIVVANPYPIPEEQIDTERGQKLYWSPLAYNDETAEYLADEAEKENVPARPIPPELVAATALKLIRNFSF